MTRCFKQVDGVEKLADLGVAQDDRKPLRLAAGGDDLFKVHPRLRVTL